MLGRKSRLTEILRSISSLPPEQRPVVGKLGNIVRVELETLIDEREAELAGASLQRVAGRRAHRHHAARRAASRSATST